MSFNEEFFNRRSTAIGVVIDVERPSILASVRNALIGLITSLDDAEDKMVVYNSRLQDNLPESLGQATADVANYKLPEPFVLETALAVVATLVGDLEDGRQVIFYFTDRRYPGQESRLERTLGRIRNEAFDTEFFVFDFGTNDNHPYSEGIKEASERAGAKVLWVTPWVMTVEKLKGVLNGKD